MIVGDRIRTLREQRNLSQGDIEERTGLLRCYISRVEHGHTVPSVETLEKISRALEIPMYQFFYEGDGLPEPPKRIGKAPTAAATRKELNLLNEFRSLFSRTDESNRRLLLHMARKMANHKAA
jgi:transcriptional regulator with XRE-family HTH domain